MKVYLNSIDGIADAFTSLLMSKRSWTPEKEAAIRELCEQVLTRDGEIRYYVPAESLAEYQKR